MWNDMPRWVSSNYVLKKGLEVPFYFICIAMLCLVKMRSPLATIHQSDHWVVVWWNFGLDHQPELQQADVIRCHPRTRVQGKHFFAESRFRCWCFCLKLAVRNRKWEMGHFRQLSLSGKNDRVNGWLNASYRIFKAKRWVSSFTPWPFLALHLVFVLELQRFYHAIQHIWNVVPDNLTCIVILSLM
mgnify:CR=1 FL=1